MRVFTEYINEKSFEQNINVERVFDPTLTVFDPLARKSHKGDGKFCGELYPMTKSEFEEEFGEEATKQMKFTRTLGGFSWSFQNQKEEIVLVCEYYEKKQKKETILQLSNGHAVTRKEYEQFIKEWEESGNIEQAPIPIKERKTLIEHIVRYRFCETEMLDVTETNFKFLPLVFVDGNSVMIRDTGSSSQMTRPYVYHAEGIQRLKNYAGQCLGNELENTVQHRFMIAEEALPTDAANQEAYRNVQKADVLTWKHFLDTNMPEITLPPPREIQRAAIPPEITQTFVGADQMMQMILGNYDSQQGTTNAPVSGIAFARSAIQSNNASVPYIVGYIKGLNRVAQIIVDLIPKYYRTPRTLPILKPDGKRSFMTINKQGSLYMNFDPNHLQVKVEAGVNFAMQKEIALTTLIAMTNANEGFAKFFSDEGLPVILDNLEIRGIDQLKEKANEWMGRQKQQEAQQAQMQQQQVQMQTQQQQMQMQAMQKELQSPTEAQIEALYVQQKAQTDAENLAIKSRDSETKFLEVMAKIQGADVDRELKAAELIAKQERETLDSVLKVGQHISKVAEQNNKSEGGQNGQTLD
jgi:hypothetical protein